MEEYIKICKFCQEKFGRIRRVSDNRLTQLSLFKQRQFCTTKCAYLYRTKILQPEQNDETIICLFCKKKLEYQKKKNGKWEPLSALKLRKFCNKNCYLESKKIHEKNCLVCNIKFKPHKSKQVFCSYKCTGINNKKNDDKIYLRKKSYNEASKIIIKVMCSKCHSTERLHIHHKDHNYLNNNIENLDVLCYLCHAKHHHPKILNPCCVCNKLTERYYKNNPVCNKHYRRCLKFGSPYLKKNQAGQLIRVED